MTKAVNIQEYYLNELRKTRGPVTIFLTNGFQLRGTIKAFDNYTVLLDSEGKEQLIYKHAISTFAPLKNIGLNQN